MKKIAFGLVLVAGVAGLAACKSSQQQTYRPPAQPTQPAYTGPAYTNPSRPAQPAPYTGPTAPKPAAPKAACGGGKCG
jgi:hypothetical protein